MHSTATCGAGQMTIVSGSMNNIQTFEIPKGTVRVTRFLKKGDHPHGHQDYTSHGGGDIDIDSYFMSNAKAGVGLIHMELGDWIADMEDGSCQLIKDSTITPAAAERDAVLNAVEKIRRAYA